MNNKDKIINIAKELNKKIEINILDIPILNDFEIQPLNNNNVIFYAISKDKSVEQLICDGKLKENETFEQRLEKVIKETLETSVKNGVESPKDNLFFYKNYRGVLDFYIYIYDYIKNVNNEKRVVRQISVYFLEPKYNNFYQLCICTPPFIMPTKILKLGPNFDLDNDSITKQLIDTTIYILNNIKYNNL